MTQLFGKNWSKLGLGLALVASVTMIAAPAEARDRWGRHRGGGDDAAIAIAAGIAGLAIGAAVSNGNHGRYYNDRYDRDGSYYPRYRGSSYYNSYPQYNGYDGYNSYPRYNGYNSYYYYNNDDRRYRDYNGYGDRYERRHNRWHNRHERRGY